MQAKIVYLRPRGSGLFRSQLRSDTLWAAICWSIRMVQGEKALVSLLQNYDTPEEEESAFFLSSSFPFLYAEGGLKHHFLPHPIEPFRSTVPEPENAPDSPNGWKKRIREAKERKDRSRWLDFATFGANFTDQHNDQSSVSQPWFGTRAMTHNAIDRTRLGTLDTEGGGLLFHTLENYVIPSAKDARDWSAGLYFLVKGNFKAIEPALRFLEHSGIAGDRGTGKGHFQIDWDTVDLPEAATPNACMTLSLFRPKQMEAMLLDQAKDQRLLRYQLVDRQGRHLLQSDFMQKGYFFFGEGSIFPIDEIQGKFPGRNENLGKHQAGHDVFRYGRAFMLNIKLH